MQTLKLPGFVWIGVFFFACSISQRQQWKRLEWMTLKEASGQPEKEKKTYID